MKVRIAGIGVARSAAVCIIEDEHDLEEDAFWISEKKNVILAKAKAPLADFQEFIGISLTSESDEDEIDTVARVQRRVGAVARSQLFIIFSTCSL